MAKVLPIKRHCAGKRENTKKGKGKTMSRVDRTEKERRAAAVREYKKRHASELAKESKSEKKLFLRTFCVFMAIFIAVLTPVFSLSSKIAKINPFGDDNVVLEEELPVLVDPESPFFQAFTESKKINVLLMGVNPPLTDTLMLVSFDKKYKKVDIISVPRDTYYHRDGYESAAEGKINAAYKGNPLNTAYAVSDVLQGIPINYYAVVEYDDVEKIVDAVGGVPMNIEKDMNYEDPYDTPPLSIHLKAGEQVLNGKDSVKFLRYRKGYAEGDLGRVKAQQVWVKNAIKQTLSLGLGMVDIAKLACQELDSDITIGAAVSIANAAVGMSSDNVTTYTMPYTAQPEPPYYVFPKTEEIEEMLTEIYQIPVEETTDAAIEE